MRMIFLYFVRTIVILLLLLRLASLSTTISLSTIGFNPRSRGAPNYPRAAGGGGGGGGITFPF